MCAKFCSRRLNKRKVFVESLLTRQDKHEVENDLCGTEWIFDKNLQPRFIHPNYVQIFTLNWSWKSNETFKFEVKRNKLNKSS